MKIFFLSFVFVANTVFCFAQHTVRFTVKDSSNNEPLIGATILEQGTKNGAVTNENGTAQLVLQHKANTVIHVQFVGYKTKDVSLNTSSKDSIEILLVPLENEVEEVTVTSMRTHSGIEDIPTRVEVLGLDEMNEENGIKPGNIMSILGDMAGVQMQQVSASSGNTYARIQGLNGRYTQLLKDGMPLFGGMSGSLGILQIPPLDLKQIEIIKGSASTLYGGDAIGGIINLVSKEPSFKKEMSVTLNQTSLNETNINSYYSQRIKNFGFTLFVAHTYQKQTDVDKDGLSDVPLVDATVIHPKFVFYFNPHSTLTFNYSGIFENRKGGDMNYFTASPNDSLYHVNNLTQRHNADAKWVYGFANKDNLTVKLSSSFLKQGLGTKQYNFDALQTIYYSEISYLHTTEKTDWVGGVNVNGDVFQNQTVGLPNLHDYNYQTLGFFLQNTWKATHHLTIESGLRNDVHSQFGSFLLPRLSFMYKFNKAISARLNGGYGYKNPVLITYINPEIDLNHLQANTTLNAERSRGCNADFNFDKLIHNKLHLTFNQSFFYTQIVNPVFDSSNTFNSTALLNSNKPLLTQGLQTYIRLKYDATEFYFSYVFTDVQKRYDNQHFSLPTTPKNLFSTVLVYEHDEEWRAGIESSLIAGQLDENYAPVKNYVLLAAMFQYNVGHYSFVLNCENLLDFRQSNQGTIFTGNISNPVFHKLWAPIDGRVLNFSVKWRL
jgi:outer membrane cobalamin receptor